jgi:hypothetical protein
MVAWWLKGRKIATFFLKSGFTITRSKNIFAKTGVCSGCVKVGVVEYKKTGNGQLNINSKLAFLIQKFPIHYSFSLIFVSFQCYHYINRQITRKRGSYI